MINDSDPNNLPDANVPNNGVESDWLSSLLHQSFQQSMDDAPSGLADCVINQLKRDRHLVEIDNALPLSQLLVQYYEQVATECPDMWPSIGRRLKQHRWKRRIQLTAIAASVACVFMASQVWLTYVNQPAINIIRQTQLASLRGEAVSPLLHGHTLANDSVKANIFVKHNSSPTISTHLSHHHQPANASMLSHSRYKASNRKVNRPTLTEVAETKAPISQQMIAVAKQALKPQHSLSNDHVALKPAMLTPASDAYVFQVSAHSNDALALGFAN